MVSFEAVMRGVGKYLDRNVYAGMNDWQEVLARAAVSMAMGSEEQLKHNLMNNGMVKAFCIMDGSGNVDAERLTTALRAEVQRKEKVSLKIPLFGSFTFRAEDVDELMRMIREG